MNTVGWPSALHSRFRGLSRVWFALAVAFASGSAFAANVAAIVSEENAFHTDLVETLRQVLDEQAAQQFKIWHLTADRVIEKGPEIFKTDFYQIVVTVGARAATLVAGMEVKAPILHTLIPRTIFNNLPKARLGSEASSWASAIFLEQPLARQLDLVSLLMPGKSRFGVLYGPHSSAQAGELQELAETRGITLIADTPKRIDELGPALRRILPRAQLLMTLRDSTLFNRDTLRSVLLSGYRADRPVIGFSRTQVKAGALAAVFTTPEQAGRQAAESILQLAEENAANFPPPQYPKYWTVQVNRQVARAFGLSIADDSELQARLQASTESEF
jgi:putative tryptophan/tyrosine transport system substrate-binding protein